MRRLFWTAGLLAACTDRPAADFFGQFGEEDLRCRVVDRVPVAPDEIVRVSYGGGEPPVETSAAALIASIPGTYAQTLTWDETEETTLVTGTLAYEGGPAERVTYEGYDTSESEVVEGVCGDALEVEFAVTIDTDDGRLAESWSGFVADHGEGAEVDRDLDPPSGTIEPYDHLADPTDYDPRAVRLSMRFVPAGADPFSGSVQAVYVGPDAEAESNRSIGRWYADSGEEQRR
jgi:hypothetical protein